MEGGNDEKKQSKMGGRRYCTLIEPIAFTTAVMTNALQITVQNFYIYKICEYRNTGENASICFNLTQHRSEEEVVQQEAAGLAIYRLLLEAVPPLFLGLIWGQLNDKLGSKLPIMLPMMGFALYPLLFYLLSFFGGVPPALFLIASIAIGCFGGGVAYSVSGFKYIVSTTSEKNRSFRIGTVEGAIQLGQPVGTLLGSQLFLWGGFGAVFLTCFIMEFVALVVVFFFLKNNKPAVPVGRQSVFGIRAWRDTLVVLFKKRPHRGNVFLLVGISCIRIVCVTSSWSVAYLFSRLRFQWGQPEFSFYTTYDGIVTAFGVILMSYLGFKVLKLSSPTMGAIVSCTCVVGSIVWGLADVSWLFYLGASIQFAQGILSIVVRSLLSFLIPGTEIGKAFSCVGVIESVMPILAGPLSNLVYIATIHSFPGAIYIIAAGLYLIVFAGFAYLYKATTRKAVESPLEASPMHSI